MSSPRPGAWSTPSHVSHVAPRTLAPGTHRRQGTLKNHFSRQIEHCSSRSLSFHETHTDGRPLHSRNMVTVEVLAKRAATALVSVVIVLADGKANLVAAVGGDADECRNVPGLPLHVQLNNGVSGTSCPRVRGGHCCRYRRISQRHE